MSAVYDQNNDLKSHELGQIAKQLRRDSPRPCRLSPLVFMTDPVRVPDLPAATARLPRGCAIIYRHFGAPRKSETARLLRGVTRMNQQQLLIGGGDIDLALYAEADGVHFKRGNRLSGPRQFRKDHPNMLVTMAGLKSGDYSAPLTCLDALFISSVFPSQSPSAGTPIGTERLREICKRWPVPIFALGGVTAQSAPQLIGSGVSGLAAIGGLID